MTKRADSSLLKLFFVHFFVGFGQENKNSKTNHEKEALFVALIEAGADVTQQGHHSWFMRACTCVSACMLHV